MIAYKLLRLRKDGTLGPLFINRKQVIPIGKWLEAEEHPTKGFAFRPGWHCCTQPKAPHLKMKPKNDSQRVWARVKITHFKVFTRPDSQGGLWALAKRMKITSLL